jgi:hypothetical protein
MASGKRALRRLGLGCTVVLVALILMFGQTIRDLWSHGFLDAYLSPDQTRKYNASSTSNLKMLYNAMSQYHESEGQFPKSTNWMDAIKSYGAASDLAKGEADKKFVTPSLAGKPGQYGYAMNDVASGKFKGDLKDPKTVLIFDSSDTSRNAHGDPKKLAPAPARLGGNLGITVDGTIVKL